MSDDLWRRGQSSEDDDFGPPLFADDATGEVPTGASGGLSFGSADTGGLPHWTEPPTGELPRTLNLPVAGDGETASDALAQISCPFVPKRPHLLPRTTTTDTRSITVRSAPPARSQEAWAWRRSCMRTPASSPARGEP